MSCAAPNQPSQYFCKDVTLFEIANDHSVTVLAVRHQRDDDYD